MSESFVLFRGSTRMTLREDDMYTTKISTIFQVCPNSIYLSDDRNTAVFPDNEGFFSIDGLRSGSHFEVNGEPTTSGASVPQSTQPMQSTSSGQITTPQSQIGRFAFASRSLPNSSPQVPVAKRPQSRTFQRSVQLVEAEGSSLLPVQTVYLRLSEADANVTSIAEKLQEHLDSEEQLVLCDSKGLEIQDTTGTNGLDFWKPQTRKVFCMTETAHREFMSGRRNKQRRRDPNIEREQQHIDDANDMLSSVLDQTRKIHDEMESIQRNLDTGKIVICINREQEEKVKDAFTCIICKGAMVHPIFATCCQSLIGCQSCVHTWYAMNTGICPKCRNEEGEQATFLATGLHEAIQALKPIVMPE